MATKHDVEAARRKALHDILSEPALLAKIICQDNRGSICRSVMHGSLFLPKSSVQVHIGDIVVYRNYRSLGFNRYAADAVRLATEQERQEYDFRVQVRRSDTISYAR